MSFEAFSALIVLASASAFTPGPNNALVASSGANFGYRRTLPHILGIAFGFALMVFIVGMFLGELFRQSELLREILRWGGAALLLYVAYKVATSGGLGGRDGAPRPFRFLEAAGFQWVNPKGWAMAIAVTSQFVAADNPWGTAFTIAWVFVLAGLSSASLWALVGHGLRRWLSSPGRLRAFNMTMGALIAACIVLLFLDRL